MPEKPIARSRKLTDRQRSLDMLCRVWQQAMEDNSPGIPADEVLGRLERKYQEISGYPASRDGTRDTLG